MSKNGSISTHSEKFADLRKPFSWYDLEWRVQHQGQKNKGAKGLASKPWAIVVPYITNRAIMDRLDEVFGPENWKNAFKKAPGEKGTLCGISIRVDNEWVTKWDGAGETQVEPIKGELSDSMKRAAVQWGIGRYLYRIEQSFATFVATESQGRFKTRFEKNGELYWWKPQMVPDWALPEDEARLMKEHRAKKAQGAPAVKDKPKTSKDGAYLKACADRKEIVGDVIYYTILGEFGKEHANQILDPETKDRFLKKLDEAVASHEESLSIPDDDIPF